MQPNGLPEQPDRLWVTSHRGARVLCMCFGYQLLLMRASGENSCVMGNASVVQRQIRVPMVKVGTDMSCNIVTNCIV